ncbi:MAG: M23 family metallopeptidase [Clostridia bacterium]|nr:M23 family metallopeptidase [Clostridia bacterium]
MKIGNRLAALVLSGLLVTASALRSAMPADPDRLTAVNADGQTYIKWIDFTPTAQALSDTLSYDVETYGTPAHASWIELLALLAARSGGNFSGYKSSALKSLTDRLTADPALTPANLTTNAKLYAYYLEAYGAVLGGMVGLYTETTQADDGTVPDGKLYYGLRAFSPVAAGYGYTHYDDFGASRSYGYKRDHTGHDLMGGVGTPVIAVESGYVEKCGWNQYGGWRIGIRSADGKRYWYYAHLRKGHPYNDVWEGKYVNAGEVIGYLGMTGYSAKEDVNGINEPHLHYGLQIIFDAAQIDGYNQIWIDMYALTVFLSQNRAMTVVSADGKERLSTTVYRWPEMPEE